AVGCAGKKRIEANEAPARPIVVVEVPPTQVPTEAPTAAPTETPTAAPVVEMTAVPTETSTDSPTPEATATATVTSSPTPAPNPAKKYVVVKGDTLWGIAGMSESYKDNFQWPLIFKANRDQIKDPDLIYPQQEFLIRHDYSQSEVDKARKDASDTPKYAPHTKPRETLPVDYF